MKHSTTALACLSLLLAGGCASVPTGPSVLALPGTGKTFDQFRFDDMDCRQYAQYQISGPSQAAVDAGVRSAALGTAVGAIAGAAIGGSDSAGVGAGTGLIFGSAVGSTGAQGSGYFLQQQYDNAYVQCMYSKGQRVPVYGTMTQPQNQAVPHNGAVPRNGAIPPPPPGSPPPPPPGR